MIEAYKVQGDHLIAVGSLDEIDLANDVAWIDMSYPSREEDESVERFLNISVPTREDMQEIEPSARLYEENGAEYLTMLAVSLVRPEEPYKCPVTFILHGRVLVTVRYADFLSVSMYLQKARRKNSIAVAEPEFIMLDLVESFINRIADSLEQAGDEIDRLSDEIFRSKKSKANMTTSRLQVAMRKVGGKGDFLSMLRESLASISRLISHETARLSDAQRKILRLRLMSMTRDVSSLADHAGFLSNKITFLLEATLGMINLEQNQIIKIFSIVAVVFLPPTLVASIYGMNFRIMPELGWGFGYPLALILMLVSAIIPLVYFKRKGWL